MPSSLRTTRCAALAARGRRTCSKPLRVVYRPITPQASSSQKAEARTATGAGLSFGSSPLKLNAICTVYDSVRAGARMNGRTVESSPDRGRSADTARVGQYTACPVYGVACPSCVVVGRQTLHPRAPRAFHLPSMLAALRGSAPPPPAAQHSQRPRRCFFALGQCPQQAIAAQLRTDDGGPLLASEELAACRGGRPLGGRPLGARRLGRQRALSRGRRRALRLLLRPLVVRLRVLT